MKALITGASSGIGRDFARVLAKRGIDLILVARREDRMNELKEELKDQVNSIRVISKDLTKLESCYELYDLVKDENIDILINNAGFGGFGNFTKYDLNKDLEMISLNLTCVHVLTKLFLTDFKTRNAGYILNVASSVSFLPGPLMATYYSTKAYVLRLTHSIYGELKKEGFDNIHISVLCPGPVSTEFFEVADVKFAVKPLNSYKVSQYAIEKMFAKKLTILPGVLMKLTKFVLRFLPDKLIINLAYMVQRRRHE